MQAGIALRGRSLLGLLVIVALVLSAIVMVAAPASADGDGSPAECKTNYNVNNPGDEFTWNAPSGWEIEGVCIKAGQLHTDPITSDFNNGCYVVKFNSPQSVTVKRIGDGPGCKEISHLDFVKVKVDDTTTTTVKDTTTTTVDDTTTTTLPNKYICKHGEIKEIGPDHPKYDEGYDSPEDVTDCESTTTTTVDDTTTTTLPSKYICKHGEIKEIGPDHHGYDNAYDSPGDVPDCGLPNKYVCEDGEIVEVGPNDSRYDEAYDSPQDIEQCDLPSKYVCEDGDIVEVGPNDSRYEDAYDSPHDVTECESTTTTTVPEETTTTTTPGETTSTTDQKTTTVDPATIEVDVAAICDNDTPYLQYSAAVSGDVDPNADSVTIHWFDANGVERVPADTAHTYTGLPMSGRVLWPGARVDSAGEPTDWPGWVLDETDGWIEADDGFQWAREDGAFVTLEVSPTSDPVTITYPPALPKCAAEPPEDEVSDVEIIDEVDDVETLPFTGLDTDLLAAVAAALIGTGAVVVLSLRRREDR